jgi:Photoprotection regulator fluorescence recovery protein
MVMQVNEIAWSKSEHEIVQVAFRTAYDREIAALIQEVKQQAAEIVGTDDMWRLHDFLSARRHDVDGKYDDAEAGLLFTFARLVKEKWVSTTELDGLEKSKLSKISALSRM